MPLTIAWYIVYSTRNINIFSRHANKADVPPDDEDSEEEGRRDDCEGKEEKKSAGDDWETGEQHGAAHRRNDFDGGAVVCSETMCLTSTAV